MPTHATRKTSQICLRQTRSNSRLRVPELPELTDVSKDEKD